MTEHDKVYIIGMMIDVKDTAMKTTPSLVMTDNELFDKIQLNFYRIADAITKIVSK